ncbi:MAG: HsdR family type I site-specific deoxyribonuclease [Ignavibacteriales bacterium]|nr:HsdR family type I site-specific deoxyribonuclease [Ignavibacteriales bacterium]
MQTPSFKEDHISQIPALQFLQNLDFTYLTPEEALKQRSGKTSNVLLEGILRKRLETLNTFQYKGNAFGFSQQNIQAGIEALRDLPLQEGYMATCEYVYDLLTLGKALEQTIDGDKKSYTLQYVDWEDPKNNVYHVTEEFPVMRSGSDEHYRPDIVLFVNGIPFVVIECKRPDLKDSLKQAISQHLRNQQEDGIRPLYVYAQLVIGLATNHAAYGTNATEEKYWAKWDERLEEDEARKTYKESLHLLKNNPLTPDQKALLFAERFRYVRQYFDELEKTNLIPTAQDEYLFGLCKPDRLLDLVHNFIIFEAGVKKIARYQQFFALKKTMNRIRTIENGTRKGGVIWHTQGSGKSLTMVMLAQAIALDESIINPKILLVTDRVDLDEQITGTFKKCRMVVQNAATGQNLIELLESKSDAVITTIINKFEAALKNAKRSFDSPNIFVLVDEGHRTQYGSFNIQMRKTLPNACFVAMTGTPLMKREKNTATRFGGLIDTYTVDVAVRDGAVVPLLYEGRHAIQKVNEKPIDTYFRKVSEPLTDYQKSDLKKKFARAEQLNVADQKIYAIAWDLSTHFRDAWQGTGFKGQLVCQSKDSAIRYKNYLDEIGIVSTEVLISPPDDREGEDTAYGKSVGRVKVFWDRMMQEHGTPKKYEQNVISRFKYQPKPEIIIVVDKLLTGFDAPANTVLYLTRNLKEHALLQAIARVNRVYPGKDFGYIVDYYGVLSELDQALQNYSGLQEYDHEDLAGTVTNIKEEIKKLPQKHSEVWDIFKTVANKRDEEAFERLLRDEALRVMFYDRLSSYSRALKLALSTIEFHHDTAEDTMKKYKDDAAFFLGLRSSVSRRYSDVIDYSAYEDQIQKLVDKHIQSDEVKPITRLVNIFDTDAFQHELEETIGEAARADKIASRTERHITEKMDEDPAFYKKFSEMLKEAIRAYEQHRLSEAQYLVKTKEIMDAVISHTDKDIPSELLNHDIARAFYGICSTGLESKIQDDVILKQVSISAALTIDATMRELVFDGGKPIIDWQDKTDITGRILISIGDFLIDEVRDKYEKDLSFDEIDEIADRCLEVAKVRYK